MVVALFKIHNRVFFILPGWRDRLSEETGLEKEAIMYKMREKQKRKHQWQEKLTVKHWKHLVELRNWNYFKNSSIVPPCVLVLHWLQVSTPMADCIWEFCLPSPFRFSWKIRGQPTSHFQLSLSHYKYLPFPVLLINPKFFQIKQLQKTTLTQCKK